MKKCKILGLLAAFLSVTPGVSAAIVDWHPLYDTVGVEDVVTVGDTVEAFNFASDGSLFDVPADQSAQIGDILFAETTGYFDEDTSDNYLFLDGETTGDASYDLLLNTLDYGNGIEPTDFYAGHGNLVVGRTYLVQFWLADLRAGIQGDRFVNVEDGAGNNIRLHRIGDGLGTYGIGVFTADSDSQLLKINLVADAGNAHMNAYQLRDVTDSAIIDLAEGRDLAAVPVHSFGLPLMLLGLMGWRIRASERRLAYS